MDKKRLRWACRRGMLELDALLGPFFDEHFDELSQAEQSRFETLLSFQDPDLFVWFTGQEKHPDADIQHLIDTIKHAVKKNV